MGYYEKWKTIGDALLTSGITKAGEEEEINTMAVFLKVIFRTHTRCPFY